MSNQWFRMYAEFATDPKVQMMSEAMQRRLLMLFCFKCNVAETLQDDEIVFQMRISNEEWQATKVEFIRRGFIDSENNLINWDKRQYISDSSTERSRKHRELKKRAHATPCNVAATPPDTEQNRTDTEQKESVLVETFVSPTKLKKEISIGKRLTEDWTLPQEWGEWAETLGLTGEAIIREGQKFKNHWISKSGANATKKNWKATWENWIYTHLEGFKK